MQMRCELMKWAMKLRLKRISSLIHSCSARYTNRNSTFTAANLCRRHSTNAELGIFCTKKNNKKDEKRSDEDEVIGALCRYIKTRVFQVGRSKIEDEKIQSSLLILEPPETTQAHSLWVAIEQNYSSTHDIALLLLSDFSCVPLPLGYNINLFSISRHFQILSAS